MTRLVPAVLILGVFGVIGANRSAAAQTPACKPVTDAMLKMATAPHHTASTSDRSEASQSIVVGNATYVQIKGVWRKSPMTPQDQLRQEQENIKTAKVYTCALLRSETVNGVVANAYKVHSESDGAVSDGTVWIAPSLGLPVKTEEDIAPSIGPKMHLSITWDYANIHAPVVK
jgi:hypothetical protein